MSQVRFQTASTLDKESSAKIASLAKSLGVSSLPTAQIEPSLLAGFVLEIEGTEYDYSLKGALNRLGNSL